MIFLDRHLTVSSAPVVGRSLLIVATVITANISTARREILNLIWHESISDLRVLSERERECFCIIFRHPFRK